MEELSYILGLDRPLSLAGRVILKKNGKFKTEIININKDLLVIPSQAIHQNREVNDRNNLNPQVDLLPIMGLTDKEGELKELLSKMFPDYDLCDYDLHLYTRQKKPPISGINDDFIVSPRLDNLACAFTSLKAFVENDNQTTNQVYCCFDNEEIGSLTQGGADSTFLSDVLNRICLASAVSLYPALSKSMLVSADNRARFTS